MKLYYAVLETKLGRMLATRTEKGLNNLLFHQPTWGKFFEELEERKDLELIKAEGKFATLRKQLKEYFTGKKVKFTDKLDLSSGSPFEQKVWRKMMQIPYGKTVSYKKLAQMAGEPEKARAVGNACAKNPLTIIVPCHRVIKSDGGLGGYAGGLERKKRLLNLESGKEK
ncbi:MAG: methylated-DNA--[protein]-cysteine S-methyltransferase [candidate division Zixibacteria bacterium]|nr:methylated-DNA--[protein]-cysteine S-methyltransferase [candidate division Zixibacteria bacterium]